MRRLNLKWSDEERSDDNVGAEGGDRKETENGGICTIYERE